jgi:ABC-type phosphate transport system substrate-binding protein
MKTLFLIFIIILCNNLQGQVAVIANKTVPVDSVSKTQLLDFYSGDIKEWNNDKPVVVFDLKPRLEIRERFYQYLGKSSSRMRSIWLKKVLSGEGDPPKALESEEVILKIVAKTPGAIGFIDKGKVDSSVKVIAMIK